MFGIIVVVYFTIVSMVWGRIDAFNSVMTGMGFLWVVVSVKINKILIVVKKFPKIVKTALKIALVSFMASFAASFVIIEGIIVYNMGAASGGGADYIIILGCQVDGTVPSVPLVRRVNAAIAYLKENQNTGVVITGGKGSGENIPEAEAMHIMLLRNGIENDRIFKEQNAKNTLENLKFSGDLYNLNDKNIVIVSSDYHIFRALSIAKKLSYKNVRALPVKSQLSVLPVYLLREYAAVVYYLMLGRIDLSSIDSRPGNAQGIAAEIPEASPRAKLRNCSTGTRERSTARSPAGGGGCAHLRMKMRTIISLYQAAAALIRGYGVILNKVLFCFNLLL
jgi:uncharacterized SAM-binding protein YcdF (DUF218 family)